MAADTDVLRIQPHEMDALRPPRGSFQPTASVASLLSGIMSQPCPGSPRGPPGSLRDRERAGYGRRDWKQGGGQRVGVRQPPRVPTGSIAGQPSSPARRLMAALNKLSARNYGKITHEVAGIISSSDKPGVLDAVAAVLSKSATDACYADVYIRMLVDVSRELLSSDDAGQRELGTAVTQRLYAQVEECLPQDGASLAEAALLLASIPSGSAAEYDDLCASVKAKKQFSGRLATALAIVWLLSANVDDDESRRLSASLSICRALTVVVATSPEVVAAAETMSRAVEALLEAVKMQLARPCSQDLKQRVVAEVRSTLPAGSPTTLGLGAKCRFLVDDIVGRAPTPISVAQCRGGRSQCSSYRF